MCTNIVYQQVIQIQVLVRWCELLCQFIDPKGNWILKKMSQVGVEIKMKVVHLGTQAF